MNIARTVCRLVPFYWVDSDHPDHPPFFVCIAPKLINRGSQCSQTSFIYHVSPCFTTFCPCFPQHFQVPKPAQPRPRRFPIHLGSVEEELLRRRGDGLRLVGRQAPGRGGGFQGVDEVQVRTEPAGKKAVETNSMTLW